MSQGSNYTQPLIEQYGAQVKALPSQPESLLALKGGNCDVSVHVNGTLSLMLQDRADEWKDYGILIPTDLILLTPSSGCARARPTRRLHSTRSSRSCMLPAK